MNKKKLYIWKLADFLDANEKIMSGEELATHLNRNNFETSYGSHFEGKRGIYTLIKYTYDWLTDMNLSSEASKVATVYVTKDGGYAYEHGE